MMGEKKFLALHFLYFHSKCPGLSTLTCSPVSLDYIESERMVWGTVKNKPRAQL